MASSAAPPNRAPRWANSPSASSTAPCPGARIRQGHKLSQRYTPERLDAACRRALEVDLIDVSRVERILLQALEQAETPERPPPLPKGRFARPGEVFAHAKSQRPQPTESTESTELGTGGQP